MQFLILKLNLLFLIKLINFKIFLKNKKIKFKFKNYFNFFFLKYKNKFKFKNY